MYCKSKVIRLISYITRASCGEIPESNGKIPEVARHAIQKGLPVLREDFNRLREPTACDVGKNLSCG